MQQRELLGFAVPAKLNAPLPSPLGPIGEIGRQQNVPYFIHNVLISEGLPHWRSSSPDPKRPPLLGALTARRLQHRQKKHQLRLTPVKEGAARNLHCRP